LCDGCGLFDKIASERILGKREAVDGVVVVVEIFERK
jgi:hypothetical protein